MTTITLSLVSHTNVGKTTLARTLLGADVGEVRDAPHVTEFADGHELVASPEGDRLLLWDTPGFGDSARLAQRLRGSSQPLGWFLSQVWDRWRDRPFWASQQALRHVQGQTDVLLYLVNAAEPPAAAGYVEPEMELLAWVGKPVLVLLNQLGAPREPALEASDVEAWRSALQRWPLVRAVLPLDAFARCWVHEATLLRAVQAALPQAQAPAMARLAAAWAARRDATFDAAVAELAQSLARSASQRQPLDDAGGGAHAGLLGRVWPSGPVERLWRSGPMDRVRQAGSALGQAWAGRDGAPADGATSSAASQPAASRPAASRPAAPPSPAEQALAEALEAEAQASTARLLALHGLAGRAPAEILQRVAGQFASTQRVPEGKAALLGGALTGALAGLKADIATGGLTLGGGLLAGALIGALGAAGLARGINVVRGTDQSWLRWSDEAMGPLVEAALLRYLAVAHFGRGRGEWVQGEAPPHWHATVAAALQPEQPALAALWRSREGRGADAAAEVERLAAALQPLLRRALEQVFVRLYPAAYHPGA
jgi:hypothetical protein